MKAEQERDNLLLVTMYDIDRPRLQSFNGSPSELGDLADKVHVLRFLGGNWINMNQADIMPQGNGSLSCWIDCLQAIVNSVGRALVFQLDVRIRASRVGPLHRSNIIERDKAFFGHREPSM